MLKSAKFWLIISICVNLLLVGWIGGGIWRFKHRSDRIQVPANEVSAILRAMPNENRRDLLGEMRREPRGSVHPDMQALADLIDAEPFDSDAVRQFFDRSRLRNVERVKNAQDAMLNALENMSPAQRDIMAQKLRHMPKRPGRGDDAAKRNKDR